MLILFLLQYDVKNRRTFLRRTKYESLHVEDLYVGSKVTIFSRHLTIVDYGNLYTSRKLGSRKERWEGVIVESCGWGFKVDVC